MAGWTEADAQRLRAAVASGALSADIGGKRITYRSVADLQSALHLVEDSLAQDAGTPPIRRITPRLISGLRPAWPSWPWP